MDRREWGREQEIIYDRMNIKEIILPVVIMF